MVTAPEIRTSRQRLAAPLVLLVLFGGFILRAVHLADPPLDFHPNRQYHSALIARSLYADYAEDWSAARRALAHETRPHQIEPPIMEMVAARLYRLAGHEALWMPRLVSVLAWMLCGLSLYNLASRWMSPPAALLCVALHASLPFGIIATRVFQPDPLMVSLTLVALERAVAWSDSRRRSIGIVAVAIGSLAVFVKPMALPVLAATYTAIAGRLDGRRWRTLGGLGVVLGCVAAPAFTYYASTMLRDGAAQYYVSPAVGLELVRMPEFWRGWTTILRGSMTAAAIPTLLLLAIPIHARTARAFIVALWVGYLLLAAAFPYHIYTHDYYSLITVPLAALTAAYGFEAVRQRVAARFQTPMQWLSIALFALVAGAGTVSVVRADHRDARTLVQRLEELDRVLPEDARLVVLDGSNGKSILFHTARRVSVWLLSSEQHARRLLGLPVLSFGEMAAPARGSDCFVVTALDDLHVQHELNARLAAVPSLPSAVPGVESVVQVFDLRKAGPLVGPPRVNFTVLRDRGVRTPPQTLLIRTTGLDHREWSFAVPPQSGVSISPLSGVGDANVRVDVEPHADTSAIAVAFSVSGRPVSEIAVQWKTIDGKSAAPIGNLETPAAGAGPDALTYGGWAFDDVGVARVVLVGIDSAGSERELAATDRFDVRADLLTPFAEWPGAGRGAWVVDLEPGATAGLVSVRVDAEDVEGHRTTIGVRSKK